MKSMTGYGRGESAQKGYKITVELSSVNRKQSEIAVYLPRELESLEPRVRDLVNRHIARGRLIVKVSLHAAEGNGPGRAAINSALAKAYAREFKNLARQLNIDSLVTLDLLLRAPGVLETNENLDDAQAFWPALEKALAQALAALIQMRTREGRHLQEDLQDRVGAMRKAAAKIQRQSPRMVKRFQQQLRQRIHKAGLEMPGLDDERLLKEVAYFADRSDITEELTRLQSHFQQFDHWARSKEPVGRTLDFLAQEMNREINTIGSKTADGLISREVVKLKADLEKFREQVQNVE